MEQNILITEAIHLINLASKKQEGEYTEEAQANLKALQELLNTELTPAEPTKDETPEAQPNT